MRIAVLGAGVAGLVAALRLTEAGHTVDVYERWPGLGGQAATLDVGQGHLLERYYHHLFSTDRHIAALYDELGMEDELEWITSSRRLLRRRQAVAVRDPDGPAALQAAAAAGARPARRRRCSRSSAARATRRRSSASPRASGSSATWAATPTARSGARCCAASSASAPTTSRWSGCRTSSGCAAATTPPRRSSATRGTRGSGCSTRCSEQIEAGGGRVLIDRPAAQARARLRRHPGRARLASGAGHDPRDFETLEPERYDAVLATVPSDVFEQLAAPGLRARGLPGQAARDRVLHRALPADRARPPVLAVLLDQHRRRRAAVRRPDRAHEPDRARALRRPPLPLRRQLPARAATSCSTSTPKRCWSATRPACRRSTRAFDRAWVKQLWLHREPAAQPIVTVGYRDKIPAMKTPDARARAGQHDADLPGGPRARTTRSARATRPPSAADGCRDAALTHISSVCTPGEVGQRLPILGVHDLPGLQLALPSSWSEHASG